MKINSGQLFILGLEKTTANEYEKWCTTLGGKVADLHQGNSVQEIVNILTNHQFQNELYLKKCEWLHDDNIQCKISIGANFGSCRIALWMSGKVFDASLFDRRSGNYKNCPNMLAIAVAMNKDKKRLETVIKCEKDSLRFPLCQIN